MTNDTSNTMIINFSHLYYDYEYAIQNIATGKKIILLDFKGVVPTADQNADTITLKSLDPNGNIGELAIKNYLKAAGEYSRSKLSDHKNIRDVKINGLPLYWLSDISEKHPYYGTGYCYFYLIALLAQKKITLQGEVHIILSRNSFSYAKSIKYFLKNTYGITPIIHCKNPYLFSPRGYISFLRQLFTSYMEAKRAINNIKNHKKKTTLSGPKHIVVSMFPQTWNAKSKSDFVMDSIIRFAQQQKTSANYLPFFSELKMIEKWDGVWIKEYINSFPSTRTYLTHLIKCFFIYIKLSRNTDKVNPQTPLQESIFAQDVLLTLTERQFYLFNHLWFQLFFKQIKHETSIFYQDEVYHTGRIISHAKTVAANATVTTIGYQHGVINPDHFVYTISDNELTDINANDRFPLPEKIIVWGNHTKSFITQWNSVIADRILPYGNIDFILKSKNIAEYKKPDLTNRKLNILWCTGLLRDVTIELSYIKNTLKKHTNYHLTIRQHPLHDIKKELTEMLMTHDVSDYTFSHGTSLQDDISNADTVITCAASTVYLDSMIFKRPVFYIDTAFNRLPKFNFNVLYYVSSDTLFESAFVRFLSQEHFDFSEIENLINTSANGWSSIVSEL